jgi:hypothetical protein
MRPSVWDGGAWGLRSGLSNPLGVISDKFEERPAQIWR